MIVSPRNERLKDIRRLKRCKGDRAVLEGPHLVAEALTAGIELETVLFTPEFRASEAGGALEARLPRPPLEVEARLLGGLADADSPQGVMAVARLARHGVERLPVVAEGVYLFADRLQDPGNLGALARAAEGLGATALALSPGCVHPNHPRALRGSAGSLLRLPVAVETEPAALSRQLEAVRPRWAALLPRGGRDPATTDLAGALVLALGAEGPGLSPGLEGCAELRLSIPLEPAVESLNVVVAAALVLDAVRRRRTAP